MRATRSPIIAKSAVRITATTNCRINPSGLSPSTFNADGRSLACAPSCSNGATAMAIENPKSAVDATTALFIASHEICDRESDLRRHHHQIHVPPRRMILRRGQLVGIAHEEIHRVRAPKRERDAEDREKTGVAGQDAEVCAE